MDRWKSSGKSSRRERQKYIEIWDIWSYLINPHHICIYLLGKSSMKIPGIFMQSPRRISRWGGRSRTWRWHRETRHLWMLGEGMGRWRWRTCRACRGLSSENFLGKTGENPVDLGWRLISPFLGLQIQGTAIWVSIPYDLVGENTVFPIQIAITGGVNHQFSDNHWTIRLWDRSISGTILMCTWPNKNADMQR